MKRSNKTSKITRYFWNPCHCCLLTRKSTCTKFLSANAYTDTQSHFLLLYWSYRDIMSCTMFNNTSCTWKTICFHSCASFFLNEKIAMIQLCGEIGSNYSYCATKQKQQTICTNIEKFNNFDQCVKWYWLNLKDPQVRFVIWTCITAIISCKTTKKIYSSSARYITTITIQNGEKSVKWTKNNRIWFFPHKTMDFILIFQILVLQRRWWKIHWRLDWWFILFNHHRNHSNQWQLRDMRWFDWILQERLPQTNFDAPHFFWHIYLSWISKVRSCSEKVEGIAVNV